MENRHLDKGSILVYTIIILGLVLMISIAILRIILPKLSISSDIKKSAISVYASDSALEWCLFNKRVAPIPPPPHPFSNGGNYIIYYKPLGGAEVPATCDATEINGQHRSVGSMFDVARSFEVFETSGHTLNVNSIGVSGVPVTASDTYYSDTTNYSRAPVPHLTSLTLTATQPIIGAWYFVNWQNCDTVSGRSCTITVVDDRTVTVEYSAITHILNVTSTGLTSGVIITNPDGYGGTTGTVDYPRNVVENTVLILTAPPTAGTYNYTFNGWSGCDSTNFVERTCTVTMSTDKSPVVNYLPPTFILAVNSSGTGGGVGVSITGSPVTYSGNPTPYSRSGVPLFTNLTLTAPATGGGLNFVDWTGCTSWNFGARTCTISNVITNITATARFGDVISPTIASWNITVPVLTSVTPRTTATSINATFTSTDTGGSFMQRADLRRAAYSTSCNETTTTGCAWSTVATLSAPANTTNWNSNMNYTVPLGNYLFALQILDNAGNMTESTSRLNVEGQSPRTGTPYAIPGTLEIENYDNGGTDVAFYDTTSSNVDTLAGDGGTVVNTVNSEWLEYTVIVATTQTYTATIRASTSGNNGRIAISIDGVDVGGGNIGLANTGNLSVYANTVRVLPVQLTAGTHILRINVNNAGSVQINLNNIIFN
jgi:hypothetical protein